MKNNRTNRLSLTRACVIAAAAAVISGCASTGPSAGPPPSGQDSSRDWYSFQWLQGSRQYRGDAICGTDAAIFVPHPNRYYHCAFTVSGKWLEIDAYGITVTHPATIEAAGVLVRTLDSGGSIVVRNGKYTIDGSYQKSY